MACKLCRSLCQWLDPNAAEKRHRFWQRVDGLERGESNDETLWLADSDCNRERNERALAIRETDPAAAFQLGLEAAADGSVWAMEMIALEAWRGVATAPDLNMAQDYYRRAIDGGSQSATLGYARLLNLLGKHEEADALLEDGVSADFIPAFFWLASLRYRRAPSRKMARAIRPLIEHAAAHGHPGAELMLGRLMLNGRFGLKSVPGGLRRMIRFTNSRIAEEKAEAAAVASGEPDPLPAE